MGGRGSSRKTKSELVYKKIGEGSEGGYSSRNSTVNYSTISLGSLRNEARELGVKVYPLEIYDTHPDLMERSSKSLSYHTVQAVKALKEKLGSNFDTSVEYGLALKDEHRQSLAEYNPFRKGISMTLTSISGRTKEVIDVSNIKKYNDYCKVGYKDKWSSTSTFEGALYHEYGHHISNTLAKTHPKQLQKFYKETDKLEKTSTYGNASKEEAFSEAFANYVSGEKPPMGHEYQVKFETFIKSIYGSAPISKTTTKKADVVKDTPKSRVSKPLPPKKVTPVKKVTATKETKVTPVKKVTTTPTKETKASKFKISLTPSGGIDKTTMSTYNTIKRKAITRLTTEEKMFIKNVEDHVFGK